MMGRMFRRLLCAGAMAMATTAVQADEAVAKKIVSGVCFLCHGMQGESNSEVFPRLAGQHWEYTAKQLAQFKSGERKSTAMAGTTAKLSSEDMVALGKYFESITLPPEPAKDAGLAAVGQYVFQSGNKFSGVPACASCHGKDALGTSQLPRLAGQNAVYIETQLKSFGTRTRTNEMAAVAEYVSGK